MRLCFNHNQPPAVIFQNHPSSNTLQLRSNPTQAYGLTDLFDSSAFARLALCVSARAVSLRTRSSSFSRWSLSALVAPSYKEREAMKSVLSSKATSHIICVDNTSC